MAICRCVVAVCIRPATCIVEISVYEPGTCQCAFLHISFESLASAKEVSGLPNYMGVSWCAYYRRDS